ncbi:MAG: FtsK/SpoIIIE domain-containing protein, partial [Ilumatobacteraceae bacterium]
VGSAAVAVAMRQPMFLIFGALGAMVAFGSWLAQRLGLLRRNRRGARSHRRAARVFAVDVALARTDFVAHHLATTSTTASARATIERRDDRLWARRGTHSDGFSVSLGTGVLAWRLSLTDATSPPAEATIGNLAAASATTCLADLPIVVNLAGGARLALRGSAGATRAAARGLLTQLAANCGPADVRIVIVTHEPAAWRWAIQLPQATNADGDSTVIVPSELSVTLAALDRPGAPHIVCVTDAAELLAARTSALRRALGTAADIALVVLVGADSGIPHLCHQSLSIPAAANSGSVPVARWVPDTNAGAPPAAVRVAGIGERAAAVLAGRLGELTDPDDPFAGIAAIPAAIGLIELLDDDDGSRLSGASVAARWLADSADPRPRTPIGVASDGIVDLDLDRDGPHGLIAGTTGSGKSELLRSLVAGMAVGSSPDHLTFVLVDYKGGATFDALTTLPHVVGVVTDLDDHLADRALRSLNAELRRREALLRQYGASDLAALRAANANVLLPRLVVVIDEFAALVAEQPEFLHALVGVAQRGRSLGVHLLLATQRPSGVISDDIRANTNIRIALRLNDTTDAIDVIGEITPALISRRAPGRAVVRLGPDEHVTFQTARCTGSDDDVPSDIDRIVAAVHAAVQIVGIATPRGPWQPPLATVIDSDVPAPDPTGPGVFAPGVFAPGVIGMVDDPDHQRIEPLRWNIGEGHLLVGGTRGSGVTSTLMTLGHAALTGSQPPHLYIIDAVGDDALLAFAHHPRCAAVVRLHENERLQRLLLRVAGIVAARAAKGGCADGEPSLLLLIDGFTALRRHLDQLDTAAQFEALESIVVNGHGTDTTVVLATDQPSAVPATTLARCPNRWIMHLADRHEANAWGFSPADVPAAIPGRVAIGVGMQAQLIRPKRIAALNIV